MGRLHGCRYVRSVGCTSKTMHRGQRKRARFPLGRSWHEAADRGSATSRQILRVEQTCHRRRGTAESEPKADIFLNGACCGAVESLVRYFGRTHWRGPRRGGGIRARRKSTGIFIHCVMPITLPASLRWQSLSQLPFGWSGNRLQRRQPFGLDYRETQGLTDDAKKRD